MSWVDDGGRSDTIAASFMPQPGSTTDPHRPQSPTDTDANSSTPQDGDGYFPSSPGVDPMNGGASPGRAVQLDSIKIPVESAPGFSAFNSNVMNRFQTLLSISTCAATIRRAGAVRRVPARELPGLGRHRADPVAGPAGRCGALAAGRGGRCDPTRPTCSRAPWWWASRASRVSMPWTCTPRSTAWLPMAAAWRQGLPLVHFSPQPEPFLSLNID